jgi:hypothetical protein
LGRLEFESHILKGLNGLGEQLSISRDVNSLLSLNGLAFVVNLREDDWTDGFWETDIWEDFTFG